MGDLAAWLTAVHPSCTALLGPLETEHGTEEIEDLLDLELQHVDQLCDLLKTTPAKKFRRALETLAIDAALPCDAAGAGPKSISEAVPPEKPAAVNLHTVGQQPTADLFDTLLGAVAAALKGGAAHGGTISDVLEQVEAAGGYAAVLLAQQQRVGDEELQTPPLHLAAYCGNAPIAQQLCAPALIPRGDATALNFQPKARFGYTALMLASNRGTSRWCGC
jgi:hypothetical protein